MLLHCYEKIAWIGFLYYNIFDWFVSNLYPQAGEKLSISGRVKNSGVQATGASELALYVDGNVTDNKVQIPELCSGMEYDFTFDYEVPENFDGTPIEFSVIGANGTKLVQSTTSDAYLEITNINLEQFTYLSEDGDSVRYNVRLAVTNTGNDVAEPSTFVLSHIENGKKDGEDELLEEVFGTCDLPAVRPGDVKWAQFQVDIPKKYFDANVLHFSPVVGSIYYNYNPQDVDNQILINMLYDYVQANEAPVVENITLASKKKVGVGQSMNLTVKVNPLTAKEFAGLTYSSSDPSVASIDANGIITGVKEGDCTITVTTKNGIQKTTKVEVTKSAVSEDDEEYDVIDKPDEKKNESAFARTGDCSYIPVLILFMFGGALLALAVIMAIAGAKKKRSV